MSDGCMSPEWGKDPEADWNRWVATDNARIRAANEALALRKELATLRTSLAERDAALAEARAVITPFAVRTFETYVIVPKNDKALRRMINNATAWLKAREG